MATTDNKTKVNHLMRFLAGRGFPTQAAQDRMVELEVMRLVNAIEPEKKSTSETHNLIAGNWRLVFTTSDQLTTLHSIPGGPLKVYFESFGDNSVHSAAPFKGMFLLCVVPVLLVAALAFAVSLRLSFVGAFLLTLIFFRLASRFGPSGLVASRRTGLQISDDGMVTSRLDRDVLAIVASQYGFDKSISDPMVSFCKKFDDSNGSKDMLKVGFLFGWRLIPKPFALHFKAHDTTRKEQIVYIDDEVRVMLGGDIGHDGSLAHALSIYVRCQ